MTTKITADSVAKSILASKENQISIIASLSDTTISEALIKKIGTQILEAYAAKNKDGTNPAKNVCNQLRARAILPKAIKVTGEIFEANKSRVGTKASAYNAVVTAYLSNPECDVATVVEAKCPIMADDDARVKEIDSIKDAMSKLEARLLDVNLKAQAAQLIKMKSTF